jgi:hypothetical protein
LACDVCGEVVPRRSNSQKYCDDCRQIATSRKVAKYYKKHSRRIRKQKAKYRAKNKDLINAKQREYHHSTKDVRRTKAELKEMALMPETG